MLGRSCCPAASLPSFLFTFFVILHTVISLTFVLLPAVRHHHSLGVFKILLFTSSIAFHVSLATLKGASASSSVKWLWSQVALQGLGWRLQSASWMKVLQVFITGRRQSALDAAVESLGGAAHATVTDIAGDVSQLADTERLMAAIKKEMAAWTSSSPTQEEAVRCPLRLSLRHRLTRSSISTSKAFFTAQKALPILQDGASIVLTSSNAGVINPPGFSANAAAKAGVRSLARTLTAELKSRNIRVDSLSPGITETAAFLPEVIKFDSVTLLPTMPMGHFVQPEGTATVGFFSQAVVAATSLASI